MTTSLRRLPFGRHPGLLGPIASAAVAGLLLTACGGGGDAADAGITGGSSSAPSLAFTEVNAKAAATNAYFSVNLAKLLVQELNLDETPGSTPKSADQSPPSASSLMRFAALLQSQAQASDPLKAAVSYTVPCAGGGTIEVTGSIASNAAFTAGDTLSTRSTNCKETTTSSDVINGTLTLTVNAISSSGSDISYQLDGFRYGGTSYGATMNGDARVVTTMVASGSSTSLTSQSMTLAMAVGSSSRVISWSGLNTKLDVSASNVVSQTLDVKVETRDVALGAQAVSYTLSTLDPIIGDESNAGRVRLSGVGNLTVTFSAEGGPLTLGVDPDGNGTADTTITLPRTEMR